MSEQEKEAALAFARTKPIEWDQFLQQWLKEQPRVIEGLVLPDVVASYGKVTEVSTTPIEEETPIKKAETKRTTTKRTSES